ncbi:MAG: glycosyltransferase family 2 protein [Proteobacteria bacterium]|nr:glycosyltransferase family 2 protein [Pseudomonadota bacterium]
MPPKISVIIPHAGGRDLLFSCLSALFNFPATNAPAPEILVADNAPADGSARAAAARFPGVAVVESPGGANLGFGAACNLSARAASGDLLVFLNNDARPGPGWLEPLAAAFGDPGLGAAGSLLLFARDPETVNSAGGDLLYHGAGLDRGRGQARGPEHERGGDCGYVSGAAMMVERAAFFAIGGFDPGYFLYNEDVDLCWRLWRRGKSVQYVPASMVLHEESATTGQEPHDPAKVFLSARNSLLTALKNHRPKDLAPALAANLGWHAAKMLAFAARGMTSQAQAIPRAWASAARAAPAALAARRALPFAQPGRPPLLSLARTARELARQKGRF